MEELTATRNKEIDQFEPGTHLNLNQIANMLEKSRDWVGSRLEDILDDLNIETKLGLDSARKAVEHYPHKVLEPLARQKDKLTIPMLAKEVGKDRVWVERRLEEMGAKGESRPYGKSGKIILSFDRNILDELLDRAKEYVDPKLGWYTSYTLTLLTGKSSGWVIRRLKQIGAEPKWFQDSQGRLREHYPLINLMQELEGWKVSRAIKSKEDEDMLDRDDSAGSLLAAVNSGNMKSYRALNKIGISDAEIIKWEKEGLITKRANGQYCFTQRAKIVARRIAATEQAVRDCIDNLNELRFSLK